MFLKLISHLSKSIQKFPTRYFSSTSEIYQKMTSLLEEAQSQLSNQSTITSALNNFKLVTSLSKEIFNKDKLQKIYIDAYIALMLSEKGLIQESQEFLQESFQLFNQLDPSADPANYYKICFTLAQVQIYHKNFDLSEELLIRCLNNAESFLPEVKLQILEKLMGIKSLLKKDKECIKLYEESSSYLKSHKEDNNSVIKILCYYGNSLLNLQEFDKALKIVKKCYPLIKSKENDLSMRHLLLFVYDSLVDGYFGIGNEDEALKVMLTGAEVIDKWYGVEKALGYLENSSLKFKTIEKCEVAVKAIVTMGEKKLKEFSEILKVYKIASEFYFKNERFEESIEYCNKGLEIARKWNDPEAMLDSYTQLADNYLRINPEIAKTFIDFGKTVLDSFPNKESERILYYREYQYYTLIQDYEKANSCMDSLISNTPENKENAQTLINTHIEHSLLHYDYIRIEKSLKSLHRALEISDKYFTTSSPNRADILSKLGSIYVENGEHEKGLEYLTEALEIEEKSDKSDPVLIIIINTSIMECYSKMNQLSLALETGEIMNKLIRDNNIEGNLNIGLFYLAFGQVYQKMIKKDKARSYYLKGKEIFNRLGLEEYIQMAEECLSNAE